MHLRLNVRRVTFLQDLNTFWVKQKSNVITAPTEPPASNAAATSSVNKYETKSFDLESDKRD